MQKLGFIALVRVALTQVFGAKSGQNMTSLSLLGTKSELSDYIINREEREKRQRKSSVEEHAQLDDVDNNAHAVSHRK